MRVFYELGFQSRGIARVITNLSRYQPPEMITVDNPESADLIVLHVIGRRNHMIQNAERIKAAGRKYAVIQYALASTRNPAPADWRPLWDGAEVVWSYYDIDTPRFYHAPLAANPAVFYHEHHGRPYTVGTLGNDYKVECIGEVNLAAWQLRQRVVHVGSNFTSDPIVDRRENLTDDELRGVYNGCKNFAALRRKDGFELSAVEALLCGARPILFDTPNYRQWFDGLAEFVPECASGELSARLKETLQQDNPVTDAEIEEAKKRFDWERIIRGFWSRCMI